MVRRLREDLSLLDGVDEDLSLRGAAPVGLGVPVIERRVEFKYQ